MKVVLASGNVGKQREFAALLAPLGFEVITQTSLGIEAVEETGASFEANALLKARHAARAAGLPALADDSGLEVDALDGRPGVYSARYAGEGASDEANLLLLLRELQAVPPPRRTARYRCALVFVRGPDDPRPLLAAGSWEGSILAAPRGHGGFGYDPIFLPRDSRLSAAGVTLGGLETQGESGVPLSAAEMTVEAKNAVSHRAQALAALVALLKFESR
jgi:XTP/dITP diphosphohydrolase